MTRNHERERVVSRRDLLRALGTGFAAAHLGATVKAPKQYLRSQPRRYPNLFEG